MIKDPRTSRDTKSSRVEDAIAATPLDHYGDYALTVCGEHFSSDFPSSVLFCSSNKRKRRIINE